MTIQHQNSPQNHQEHGSVQLVVNPKNHIRLIKPNQSLHILVHKLSNRWEILKNEQQTNKVPIESEPDEEGSEGHEVARVQEDVSQEQDGHRDPRLLGVEVGYELELVHGIYISCDVLVRKDEVSSDDEDGQGEEDLRCGDFHCSCLSWIVLYFCSIFYSERICCANPFSG